MPLRSAIRRLEAVLAAHPHHRVIHLLGLPPVLTDAGLAGIDGLVQASLRAGHVRLLREITVAVASDLAGYRFPMPDPPVGPPS